MNRRRFERRDPNWLDKLLHWIVGFERRIGENRSGFDRRQRSSGIRTPGCTGPCNQGDLPCKYPAQCGLIPERDS